MKSERTKKTIRGITAGILLTGTRGMKIHADGDIDSATSQIWTQTLNSVKPLVNNIVLPAAILVVVVMLIGLAIRSYRDYKQTGEINWGLIVVLFIVLGILIVFRSTDLLWNIASSGSS